MNPEHLHDDPHQRPEADPLSPGEIDLTGKVSQTADLVDVIGDAITTAGDDHEVPEWGARVMARLLANLYRDATALDHFAATGNPDRAAIDDKLATLWRITGRPVVIAESINRLSSYLHADESADADAHRDDQATAEPAPAPSVDEQALAALLRLPDVTAATASERFRNSYVGSYATLRDLVADVVETLEFDHRLEDSDVAVFASIDPDKVIAIAHDTWDIVKESSRYYCFWK